MDQEVEKAVETVETVETHTHSAQVHRGTSQGRAHQTIDKRGKKCFLGKGKRRCLRDQNQYLLETIRTF